MTFEYTRIELPSGGSQGELCSKTQSPSDFWLPDLSQSDYSHSLSYIWLNFLRNSHTADQTKQTSRSSHDGKSAHATRILYAKDRQGRVLSVIGFLSSSENIPWWKRDPWIYWISPILAT